MHTGLSAPPEREAAILERAHRLGFAVQPLPRFLSQCQATKYLSYAVAPNGDLHKCWNTVARTHTRQGGSFRTMWRGRQAGRFAMRVVAPGSGAAARRVHGKLTVYRPVTASWYGPGLYGNRTACGFTLRHRTRGVAHRSLPCGARVPVYRNGLIAIFPVIDRGPYSSGVQLDLTRAAARKLGLDTTSAVRAGY